MKRKIKHQIEYCIVTGLAWLIRIFGLSAVRIIAVFLGDFINYVVKYNNKILLNNLTSAFPEKTHSEILEISKAFYRNLSMTLLEFLYFPKFTIKDIENMFVRENEELLKRALNVGKGGILVGGHFGNWELLAAYIALKFPINAIALRQSNIKVDIYANALRAAKNISIIPKIIALRGTLRALKRNEFVFMLSDQDDITRGTFVNFFGMPASTPKGAAAIALRSGCPLIFFICIRNRDGFVAKFEEVKRPCPTGDNEKDIQLFTQEYTSILEKYCRQYPEQWLWTHPRWKTKPN